MLLTTCAYFLSFFSLNRLLKQNTRKVPLRVEVAWMFPGAAVSLWASIILQLRHRPNAAAAAGIELIVLLAASGECC